MSTFAERLKELRIEHNLSFKALSKYVNITHSSLCRWENKISEPQASQIISLAKFFRVSTDYLLGLED